MTDGKLNIPDSVAEFIQGRVPKSVSAKHYMQLKRKATLFYHKQGYQDRSIDMMKKL